MKVLDVVVVVLAHQQFCRPLLFEQQLHVVLGEILVASSSS